MTDKQKLPHNRKAEAAQEKYKQDMMTWTTKMNKTGKMEIISEAEAKLDMAKMKLKDLDK